MHPHTPFGELLRRYRIAASQTQEALAERAGLSVRGISDLERGINTRPRLETVRLLIEALGLSTEERALLSASAHPGSRSVASRVSADQQRAQLPMPLTPLVGRESEVAIVCGLLREPHIRLLTLTGTGGVGKTRLAFQVAAEVRGAFADGTCAVLLAPVSEPEHVRSTIAHALRVPDSGDDPLDERLVEHLRHKQLLLVLDNFEHLLPAAPGIADLLAQCPGITALVTSRAPLRVRGEQEMPVPPLAVPVAAPIVDLLAFSRIPAVALFVARGHAVNPLFRVTEANAADIAEICKRLDGLPLALELAAARVRILPAHTLLSRLDHRLRALIDGPRDLPARQRTLRDTIAWSYDLLDLGERALFARLAIFVGGWTLEAAEAICAGAPPDTTDRLQGIASLAEKHLVETVDEADGQSRFRMLETIREFAQERLTASGEHRAVARAHAAYYWGLAERTHPEWSGMAQERALARLERDHDNLRAALGWLLEAGEGEAALRLASALSQFWSIRGYLGEGYRWIIAALDAASDAPPVVRALALNNASYLVRMRGEYPTAQALAEEGLAIGRAERHRQTVASALFNLALIAQYRGDAATARAHYEEQLAIERELGNDADVAYILGNLGELARQGADYATAQRLVEQSLALLRQVGSPQGIAYPLNDLGVLARDQGNYRAARAYLEESLVIRRAVNEKRGLAHSLANLGLVARDEGDHAAARALFEESLSLLRALGDRQGIVRSLSGLAAVTQRAGDPAGAEMLCKEGLRVAAELEDRYGVAECSSVLAEVASTQGDALHAARLWGAAAAMRSAIDVQLPPADQAYYERIIGAVRAQCAEGAWTAAWEEGRQADLIRAMGIAHRALPGL